jgi:hypothetical protein
MSSSPTTEPLAIAESSGAAPAWQKSDAAWSFDFSSGRIIGGVVTSSSPPPPLYPNHNAYSTRGPQKIASPRQHPSILKRQDFGRRRFQALQHWEGVVEQVTRDGFVARLIPLGLRETQATEERTEFSLDELSYESDRSLVEPGSVFYWTVGKAWNAAGTLTNVSLVRFRRIPAPAASVWAKADAEALGLLTRLRHPNGSDSASSR